MLGSAGTGLIDAGDPVAKSPNVVLHLGAHKTATSLIQLYLKRRPRELRRMGVVALSREECTDGIGWGYLPRTEPSRLQAAVEQASRRPYELKGGVVLPSALNSVAGRPRTVIVSYENALWKPFRADGGPMYPRAPGYALSLANCLERYSPRVIYYIRSQEEFLESYYLQTVHEGGTASFVEWMQAVNLERLSWSRVVDSLAAAFGPERVTLKDFAELRKGANAFLADFLHTCDPSLNPTVSFKQKRNISISQRGLEIAMAINPHLETVVERQTTRRFLQRNFNNTTSPRPVLLDEETKAAVRERYAAENRELLAKYRGPERADQESSPQ